MSKPVSIDSVCFIFVLARDLLGSDHVISCEDILETMLRANLLTKKEFNVIKDIVESES